MTEKNNFGNSAFNPMAILKEKVKKVLQPKYLSETSLVRKLVEKRFRQGLPFCPYWLGDLLFLICLRNGCKKVLEIGFATGSSALYLLAGTGKQGG